MAADASIELGARDAVRRPAVSAAGPPQHRGLGPPGRQPPSGTAADGGTAPWHYRGRRGSGRASLGSCPDGNSFICDGSRSSGSVKPQIENGKPFTSSGAIRMAGAQITGSLSCSGAQIGANKDGNALVADELQVNVAVLLNGGFAASGAVRLAGADITGQLSCRGGQISGTDPEGNSLIAPGMRVGGSAYLELAKVGVEGTGSYGAGLARYLAACGVEVAEVIRPNRQARRQRGKSRCRRCGGGRAGRPQRRGVRGAEEPRRAGGVDPGAAGGPGRCASSSLGSPPGGRWTWRPGSAHTIWPALLRVPGRLWPPWPAATRRWPPRSPGSTLRSRNSLPVPPRNGSWPSRAWPPLSPPRCWPPPDGLASLPCQSAGRSWQEAEVRGRLVLDVVLQAGDAFCWSGRCLCLGCPAGTVHRCELEAFLC